MSKKTNLSIILLIITFLILFSGLLLYEMHSRFIEEDIESLPKLHLWVKGAVALEDNLLRKNNIEENGVIKISSLDFDKDNRDEYVVLRFLGASGGTLHYYKIDDDFSVLETGCFIWNKASHYSMVAKRNSNEKWELTFQGSMCQQ